ncbi:MAG TPA: cytochrome P450 [Roseiflexaceae bacterium]|nr:cytochrome P450 [Roseiflexaceae bacterium]
MPAPSHTGVHGQIPPGPPRLPVLGNLLQLSGRNSLQSFLDLRAAYGDIVALKIGPRSLYLVADPESVHRVLVKNQKNYVKGAGYRSLRLLVGHGLLTSDGELWRQQRRLMQPSFTPAATGRFLEMMVEVTQGLIQRWQPAAEQGHALNMDAEMMRLTMSVIGRAMFGVDLSTELAEVGRAFHGVFNAITNRTLAIRLPLGGNRRFERDMATIERFVADKIAEGRAKPDSGTMLSVLLRSRDEESNTGMSEAQLRDEVVTLFFAGFETTARSLTWAWYVVSRHPRVRARLEQEADQVLGGRAPGLDDLHNLSYTRMVVDETLRLYPPTAVLPRDPVADDELAGYRIPAGSMVLLLPFAVHRNPALWPEPDLFQPERFTPEAEADRPKYAYIPFASGPRVCLGNSFALLEMVLALAIVSARYRVEHLSAEEIAIGYQGTIKPSRPLMVRLERR